MSEAETTLEADDLRVVFFRDGDRYAHRVDVRGTTSDEWRAALESREGEPGDEWPSSPPFQQLHVERRPSGPVVFLIGMAGKTHWSAAVEVAADRKSIKFDVAARVQLAPERLGSEYFAAADASTASGVVVDESKSLPSCDGLRVEAVCPTQVPATISWNYVLRR